MTIPAWVAQWIQDREDELVYAPDAVSPDETAPASHARVSSLAAYVASLPRLGAVVYAYGTGGMPDPVWVGAPPRASEQAAASHQWLNERDQRDRQQMERDEAARHERRRRAQLTRAVWAAYPAFSPELAAALARLYER
jgi:hypothetical protein